MKIAFFGGTGNVGKEILKKLLQQNHEVSLLTRQSIPSTDTLHHITGNVLNYTDVESSIHEGDKIIIALGFNNSDHDTMSRGTKNIIDAMKAKKCTRLICLSSHGVGESWEYLPASFREIVMVTPVLKASFHDHGVQEELIKASGLDWTIVRPTEIIETLETGIFSINRIPENPQFHISKYDVAQCIVDETLDAKYSGKTMMITN